MARMLVGLAAVVLVVGCAAPGGVGEALLPGILIQRGSQTLRIEGQVCIEDGILEYLAVADAGKEYESVFALHCRPSHLQVAMLIAGYQVGEVTPELRGDFSPQDDPAANIPREGTPEGTRPPDEYWDTAQGQPTCVTIEVEVQQPDGTWRRSPVESFLLDRDTGGPPAPMAWAFTGSFFHRDENTGMEFFVADTEKSLIALWYDPTALLNVTQDVGNPYRGEVAGLEVNPVTLPSQGTSVRLILRPVGRGASQSSHALRSCRAGDPWH